MALSYTVQKEMCCRCFCPFLYHESLGSQHSTFTHLVCPIIYLKSFQICFAHLITVNKVSGELVYSFAQDWEEILYSFFINFGLIFETFSLRSKNWVFHIFPINVLLVVQICMYKEETLNRGSIIFHIFSLGNFSRLKIFF